MINTSQVARWVKHYYGLEGHLEALPGYDELNFLFTTETHKWVVKIATDPKAYDLAQAQAEMTQVLSEKSEFESCFPTHLKNKTKQFVTSIIYENQPLYLRIAQFLPGKFWAETKVHTPNLIRHFGQFLGEMDKTLAGCDWAATHRYLDWDIQHALDWERYLPMIKNHADRRLAAYFLLQFKEQIQPQLFHFRRAVIHNDANDWNVLVEGEKVTGLIDFGDVVYAPLINNLAIALTYVLLTEDEPLTAAATMVAAYHKAYELKVEEVDVLYYLIAARLCVSVCYAAFQRGQGSTNPHHFLTEKQAWPLLHKWIKINPLRAQQQFRAVCGLPLLYTEKSTHESLLDCRRKHVGRNLSISYRQYLKIERGALQYLYDDRGNTYLDCVNNVSHVGHCHPTVVKAMQRQIATLNTNTRYLHDALEEYAEQLCATLPGHLKVCYFVNSGSEANDLAVRMARHYTGQKDVIVLDHAYHGTSTLAIEMSPYKFDGRGGFPQPDYIHKAQNPDCYRGSYRYDDREAGQKYAADVKRICDELAKANKQPAAFICETLLGVGGQIPLPDNYLPTVYRHIHDAGGVAIADEVQVGFGRVGEQFWGFQLQNALPDIVVMGKPIGDGHPLAAVVVTEEIAEAFNNGMEYFNTYGGNPVSMVTGKAVLSVIQEEELQKNALQVGQILLEELKKLQSKYKFIGDVRGKGLFVGAEFVKSRETLEPELELLNTAVETMKNRGFLLSTDGPLHNVLKIKPPIIFSEENARDLVTQLDAVLDELTVKQY